MAMELSFKSPGCDCKEQHADLIQFLEDIVHKTYAFRDRYFETHKLEDAIKKNEDIEQCLEENLSKFNNHERQALEINKTKFYYLKGKLLNVLPEYSKDAESLLSKAIKLDPKLVDAWNELGECYCKNNDLTKAISCFEGALKEEKNKVALRNLSILSRQGQSNSREKKIENIEKGLNFAKDAVNLDPQDGLSWAILGNAHLSYFFGIQQNPRTLKQCLSAYTQAERDIVARSTPDLHYNKGITLKYEEEFKLALDSFGEASLYDPTWKPPQIKEEHLIKYLQEIQEMVETKGRMKPKRLQQILQFTSLTDVPTSKIRRSKGDPDSLSLFKFYGPVRESIDSKKLGPYFGGSYTSSSGKSTVTLEEVPLTKLKSGLNEENVVLGKVVCSIRNEDTVPFTFCIVDKDNTCVVVTVFNLADGKGVIIGDSVAIPEPYVTDVNFSYKDHTFKFRLLRIETPIVMVVNGKKVSKDLQAGVQMSISKKFD